MCRRRADMRGREGLREDLLALCAPLGISVVGHRNIEPDKDLTSSASGDVLVSNAYLVFFLSPVQGQYVIRLYPWIPI